MSAFNFGRQKYGAKSADGFGSKLERSVYQKLLDRQFLGEITDIKRQQSVLLEELKEGGERRRWKVDFSFVRVSTGEVEYAEAKGYETNDYLRKKNMWKRNPPARLEIWKGSHRRLRLAEVILPKEGENNGGRGPAENAQVCSEAKAHGQTDKKES